VLLALPSVQSGSLAHGSSIIIYAMNELVTWTDITDI
jgi:hypothetical protein